MKVQLYYLFKLWVRALFYILTRLSFYGHNQLYGKWLVASQIPGESEIGKRELRASFEVQGAGAYLFSASEMEIVATEEVLDIPFIKRNNGFDILGRDCTTFEVLEFITNSKFQKKISGGTFT